MLPSKKQSYFLAITLATVLLLIIAFLGTWTYLTTPTKPSVTKTPLTKTVLPITTPTTISTPDTTYGYIARTFSDARGKSLPYYLYIPPHYDPGQKYPLILMLEGSGESSNLKRTPEQNKRILFHASYVQVWSTQYSSPYNPDIQHHWPSFVVVPQLTTPQQWVNTDDSKGSYKQSPQPSTSLLLTKELLDALQHEYSGIDSNRLYITGLSLGGYGTWDAIERWPGYFAAAVPIAGAGDPLKGTLLTHLPIWAFHGGNDSRVPVAGSRDMIKAIRAAGGNPRYTEFAGADHGIWGRVYGTDATGRVPDFFPWLFSQHKE